MRSLLFAVVLICSPYAFAKNVALLLAGTSLSANGHEFLRNSSAAAVCLKDRGFDVTVMAGGPHKGPGNTSEELIPRNKEDYDFLFSLQNQGTIKRQELNRTTMEATLASTLANLNSGDTLELQVSAHGTIVCGKDEARCSIETERPTGQIMPADCRITELLEGETPEKYPDLKCKHYIGIGGRSVPSELITSFLQAADRKGVKVNYTMESCFSGFEKPKVVDLKNVCSYYAAGDRNVGAMCSENDDQAGVDYAALNVNTALKTRACRGREQLLNAQYFKNGKCLQAALNQNVLNLPGSTSMFDVFAGAREKDRLPTMPNLSCLSNPHFDNDLAMAALVINDRYPLKADDCICSDKISPNLTNMLGQILGDITDQLLKNAVDTYFAAIQTYNDEIEKQRPAIEPCVAEFQRQRTAPQSEAQSPSASPSEGGKQKGGTCAALATYQEATRRNHLGVISAERALFAQLRKSRPDIFAGCQTSACSQPLPE